MISYWKRLDHADSPKHFARTGGIGNVKRFSY